MSQRICVFGDSIAWGAEDQEAGGWVDRLKVFIKKTGKFNQVYNLGNPGKDSGYLVEFMDGECRARFDPAKNEVNVVIVQNGMNDSQYLGNERKMRTPPEMFAENMMRVIEIAKKYVANVVLIGITNVDEERTTPIWWSEKNRNQTNEKIKEYNKLLEDVCDQQKVKFIDIFGLLESGDIDDGLHPNARGHEKIYQKILGYLEKSNLIIYE